MKLLISSDETKIETRSELIGRLSASARSAAAARWRVSAIRAKSSSSTPSTRKPPGGSTITTQGS